MNRYQDRLHDDTEHQRTDQKVQHQCGRTLYASCVPSLPTTASAGAVHSAAFAEAEPERAGTLFDYGEGSCGFVQED